MELKYNFTTTPLAPSALNIEVFACQLDGLDEPSGVIATALSGLRVEIHPMRSSSARNAELARTILGWQHRQLELERLLLQASQRLELLEPNGALTQDLCPREHPQLYRLTQIAHGGWQRKIAPTPSVTLAQTGKRPC